MAGKAKKLPSCGSGEFWLIKPGDSIYKIANATGRSIQSIYRANPGINPDNLKVGKSLCLPAITPCPSGVYWTVEFGDSLYKIAKATGSSVNSIIRANPGINPQQLEIGHKLCIP